MPTADDAPRPALDAAALERLRARVGRLLTAREGTMIGTDGYGGGYVQDGLLGRQLCRSLVLRDAQDIGAVLAELPALLAAAAERGGLAREAARYKAALAFYADADNWTLAKRTPGSPWVMAGMAWPDKGERARAALAPAAGEATDGD